MDHRDHSQARRSFPDSVPGWMTRRYVARRPTLDRVEEKCPRAALSRVLQFLDCHVQIGEVDDRDRVQAIRAIGKMLREVVVAATRAGRAIGTDEIKQLPIPTGVDEAVVDTNSIHPFHTFRRGGFVLRVKGNGPAALLRSGHEPGKELGRRGSTAVG